MDEIIEALDALHGKLLKAGAGDLVDEVNRIAVMCAEKKATIDAMCEPVISQGEWVGDGETSAARVEITADTINVYL